MVTVLVHPTADNLKNKPVPKRRFAALLRRLEACEDPIVVLPKPCKALVNGGRFVYDGFPKNTFAQNGSEEIARIVDKNERITLGGFMHGSCLYSYAYELRRFHKRNVMVKEGLTDAALWYLHDTKLYKDYAWLLDEGVNFDPMPVKRMFYVSIARRHSSRHAWEHADYCRTYKEAKKALLKHKSENVDGSVIGTELLYASGLKLV